MRLRKFYSPSEVRAAHDNAEIRCTARSRCSRRSVPLTSPTRRGGIVTTAGRVLFNDVVPAELGLHQRDDGQEDAREPRGDCYASSARGHVGPARRAQGPGLQYATQGAFTVGIDDVRIPPEKDPRSRRRAPRWSASTSHYRNGVITEGERYNKVIDTWTHATTEVEQLTFDGLSRDRDGFNPIFMMADSGSRGNREQIRQLAGMRGLMAKPQKKITGGSARSSSRRSSTTSRKASPCSSTSSRRTARARVWPTRRSRPRTRLPHAAARGRGAGRDHQRAGLRHHPRPGRCGALKDGEDVIEPALRPRAGPGGGRGR
jgi:DNA-directed RNA polymerase beta' subunit